MGRIEGHSEQVLIGQGTIISGEYFTVMKNSRYQADATVPGFIYCPAVQAGGFNMIGFGPARELARRGYPVICGDFAVTPTKLAATDGTPQWGSDLAKGKVDTYRTFLQGALGAKAGKIGLLYGSAGCALAYSWAKAHPTDVLCMAGAIGTVDVEDIRANNRNSFQAGIESAYTNNAGWQAARPTHNPVEVVASLSAFGHLDYYSTDDAVADNGSHADHDAFATAAGSSLTRVSLGAIGHSIGPLISRSATETDAFCDWVEAHLA